MRLQAVADPVGAHSGTSQAAPGVVRQRNWFGRYPRRRCHRTAQTPALRCCRVTRMQLGRTDRLEAWTRLPFKIPAGDSAAHSTVYNSAEPTTCD
jgi:hypothetical protein